MIGSVAVAAAAVAATVNRRDDDDYSATEKARSAAPLHQMNLTSIRTTSSAYQEMHVSLHDLKIGSNWG